MKILFCAGLVAAPRAKLAANAKKFRHFPAVALFGDGVDSGLYRGERILNPLPDGQTLDQCDGRSATVEFQAVGDHPGKRLLKQFNPFVYRSPCDI